MRAAALWCGVSALAVVVQAMLAGALSPTWVPDLSLLAAMAAALVLGPAEGLVAACLIGLGTDMLSGSLMGQHGFVRVVEFVVVRVFAGQLDLARAFPQVIMALALSALDGVLMAGLSSVFSATFPLAWSEVTVLAPRAFVTACGAPLVGGAAVRVAEGWGDGEGRQEIRLETRRSVL